MMGRIHSIQYLRALAALVVVMLHASRRVEPALPAGLADGLLIGHAGVDLFFVISGFFMWTIGRDAAPAEFLLRRAIRVVPLYWIATLAWLALIWAAGLAWVVVTPEHVALSLAFIPHLSPSFPGEIWPLLIPGWTLTYEMFFYAAFACTLLAFPPWRLAVLASLLGGLVLLGVLSEPGQAWAMTYTSPLLLEFLGGCLVAEIWCRNPGGLPRNLAVLAAGLLLLALGPAPDASQPWSRTLGFGLPALCIVSAAAGLSHRLPRLPSLERLGDASYAIYLFHTLFLQGMTAVWLRLPALHGPVTAVLFIVAALALSSVLGLMIHRHVERPLQRQLTATLMTRMRRAHALR
jgi:exopolysaccharide production protein ExoZ